MKDDKLLKVSFMMQDFSRIGRTEVRKDEEINEMFCRSLDGMNINYKVEGSCYETQYFVRV